MRIAHTSDWHLGRSFGEVSLRDDQARFCDWFVELVREEACELVVIAGDIYDRAIAPTESIDLFRDTVRRLLATRAKVVAITGNHDAADRVAAYSELLDQSGLLLRGGYDRIGEVIPLPASDGPLDLVLLPFLHPQNAPDGFGTDPAARDTYEHGDS
ncbi:MAG: exonuclease SbcCD subunit D [Actinomycetota bacterium]